MFNLMAFLVRHSDELSERARSEVNKIIIEHDKQMIQKGITDPIHKEKPS